MEKVKEILTPEEIEEIIRKLEQIDTSDSAGVE